MTAAANKRARRLPASVINAAQPPSAKKPRKGGRAAAKPPPPAVENDEPPMYDAVSDSGSDGETARLLKRAKEEGPSARRRGDEATACVLTEAASRCVRDVTDDALVEAAKGFVGKRTLARALAVERQPEAEIESKEDAREAPEAPKSAPIETLPPPSPPKIVEPSPERKQKSPAKLETFDDMFSMFTGGSRPSVSAAVQPRIRSPKQSNPPPRVTASPPSRRPPTGKPKVSFMELMSSVGGGEDDVPSD